MADERNLNDINDDLINNTNDLLDLHNSLNDILNEERETISNISDSLSDIVDKKSEISDITNDISESESNIRDHISDENDLLSDIVDKKSEISDITNDISESESNIRDHISDENDLLSEIVNHRENELTNLQQTVEEQERLCGLTSDVLTNLQSALTAQQQLNAAIAAGASGSTNPTQPNSGSTNPTQPTNDNRSASSKWYSKSNLAKSAFQGSVDLVKKYGKEAIDKWIEIDRHVFTTGRQIGMTTTQMRGFQKNILENYGEMANRLGMTFEEIFKFQESYTQSVGRSVILTNKQVESFAGLSKIMGETAVNDMAKNMDDFGASSQTAIDYLTLGMARAANQGLNIKSTSEMFAKNIKMASRFTFSKGVDGISKMTLLSQRLKFNMESIGGAIDKFSTIEGAITSSANLQVLGGAYAANYSNPLQAMGEALLDAEGFTNRIVDTVSKTAFFNKDTGMVEMSPIEKAKMREASKIYGIDYNELWNMASQQAKMRDIDKYVSGKDFTEEQKTFLANTAQYDAKTGAWTVTKMNENGEQKSINISDLNSKELEEIQKQNDVEKSIQGDVRSIRNKLEEYLNTTVSDTKTYEEAYKGQKERLSITTANAIDPAMDGVKDLLKSMSLAEFALVGITTNILGFLLSNSIGSIGGRIGRMFNRGARPRNSGGGSGSGSSIFRRGAGRGLTRTVIRTVGRGGARAMRALPVIGTALAIGDGVYSGYEAISRHSDNVKKIESDKTLSKEEKEKKIQESREDRNENIGGAVGGTVGGVLGGAAAGAAVGSVVPVVGTAIGAVIGGLAGWWAGDKAGRAIGRAVTSNNEVNNTDNRANNSLSQSSVTSNNEVNNNQSINRANNELSQSSVTSNNEVKNNDNISNNLNNAYSQVSQQTNNNFNEFNYINDTIINNGEMRNKLLSMIQEDVRKISLDTISSENKFNYSASIMPKNQYDTKTFIREVVPTQQVNSNANRLKVDKIDLNISGTLKVQGVGKTQNIDINEIFQSPEFQRMLINKINEGFSRNGNVVQTRSLDSTQAIMGGYYTPNQLNSKN